MKRFFDGNSVNKFLVDYRDRQKEAEKRPILSPEDEAMLAEAAPRTLRAIQLDPDWSRHQIGDCSGEDGLCPYCNDLEKEEEDGIF